MAKRIGVLLLNLGSPVSPTTPAVRRYLREFLMDPNVLDINWVSRALLVYGPISWFRSSKSAHAYQSVWMKDKGAHNGSPLIHYSQSAALRLQPQLEPEFRAAVAMRYQHPSIESALRTIEIEHCDELRVLPLYPQFASSATVTAEVGLRRALKKFSFKGPVRFLKPFYDHPRYIASQADRGRELWQSRTYDHVLFSFHGLPERQIKVLNKSGTDCLSHENCCDLGSPASLDFCYRKQCFKNAKLVADQLGLKASEWSVSFQSRLGRTPWIKPYTDFVLPELILQGKKRVLVYCPSFVADCLETLEEIAIRERNKFIAGGGEELRLVPSLNDSPEWISTLKEFVSNADLYCETFNR